jgi:Uma2 family endonuclease
VSSTITKLVTAEELLAMPDDGFRYELVKGELIRMPPPGHEHGIVAMHIAGPLYQHVKSNNLGEVYAAETGFLIHRNPDTVRAPDSAFIRRQRLDETGPVEGYWVGAPDLCVEVVSPSDSVGYVEEKVTEWIKAGTRMVWVVSPKLRTVTVYRSLTRVSTLTEVDTLEGDDVVPGFKIAIAEIFGIMKKD